MFTLSDNALKELNAFFADKEKSSVRIYMAPGGCSGPRLGLALDASSADDEVLEHSGYTFCLTKDLWQTIGGLHIDVTDMGFTLNPTNPLPGSGASCCGGCGSSATSGGCGSGCGGSCH